MEFSPSCNGNRKPMSRMSHHKEMYKSPGRNMPSHIESDGGNQSVPDMSPSWRNAYKKRCFDEFKKSRQKLLGKFRNLQVNNTDDNNKPTKLKDYLEEELQKICLLEAKTNHSLITIDEAVDMYKQIQSELIPNTFYDLDDQQIEEIIRSDLLEEELATSASTSSTQVVCPVCLRANLVQEHSHIYCGNLPAGKCQFKVSTAATSLDLSRLAARLQSLVAQHSCSSAPGFMFNDSASNSSCLIMLCQECGFMEAVI